MIDQLRAFLGLLAVCGPLCLFSMPSIAAAAGCPNEGVRTGSSADLPDCRAYELVSPADTNGRVLGPLSTYTFGQPWDAFPVEMASPGGDSVIFESFAGALAKPGGASGAFDLYSTAREPSGWVVTDRISRTADDINWTLPGGISSDHQYSFANEHARDYLRHPNGEFELTGIGANAQEPYVQGRYITNGGGHVIFSTGKSWLQSQWCNETPSCEVTPLEEHAPPSGIGAVYDRNANGSARVVSLLPGEVTPSQQAFYLGSSANASSIAFEVAGTLYVRVDNGKENERTEEAAPGSPAFGGLSNDGRFLFFVVGGKSGTIHRLDTETEADVEINATGEAEIVNVSADGSHVYFISSAQLDGTKGTPGAPNMYVWAEGSVKYVTTVLPSDLVHTSTPGFGLPGPALTKWTEAVSPSPIVVTGPGMDSSRSTPNGQVLVFESRAALTGYDNEESSAAACGDPKTAGEGCTEIYRYEASTGNLSCISCASEGQPATGEAHLQNLTVTPPWIVIHNLSRDGSRVFFETTQPLVAQDVNEANDVYQWHQELGGSTVNLISSGRSPAYPVWEGWRSYNPFPNALFSITPDGSDVFFTASEALVPGAPENGTQAIYDARVNGGFPVPAEPAPCGEEYCKPPSSSSEVLVSPSPSEQISGRGNVKAKKHSCKSKRKSHKQLRKACSKSHRKHTAASARISRTKGPEGDVRGGSDSLGGYTAPQSTSTVPVQPQGAQAGAATAAVSPDQFGIEHWEAALLVPGGESGVPSVQAGRPSDFQTKLEFNHYEKGGVEGGEEAFAAVEDLALHLPSGLLGNPRAVPTCSMGDFSAFGNCPRDTQVGISQVKVGFPSHGRGIEPVYNLTPPHPNAEVARFGFIAFAFPVFIDVKVRTDGDYGVTATSHDPPGLGVLIRAKTTLWANPSASEHDGQRATPDEAGKCPFGKPCIYEEDHEGKAPEVPRTGLAFMTNPSACQEGSVGLEVTSYQLPGQLFTANAPLAPITDCTGLPFAPSFEADPTTHVAGAPTGLKTTLKLPQHLLASERATSTMREARVTLPAGMQVAAGTANWIGTCSEEEVGYHEEVDTNCPDSSKLGTAKFISPAIATPIEGTIYQRSPQPGHQLGLWLTSDALGLHIKLPGELEPDKNTGRLTAVFKDLPQVPVEEIDLNVWGGPRAPLQNPDHCGTFTTDFSFSPHSNDPAATGQSTMQITEGCNQGFNPTLHAGVTEPTAGKYSPFVFDLTRPDGDQALRGFDLKLPKGELAKIKGIPLCPDADAAAASCPQGSRIGSLQATSGPGPEPFTIPAPGKGRPQIYLAGRYQGSPFSIVSEVPAQAGPFDLGTLVVRSGLAVEPETGIAVVKADPLPQFFEGVGIAYRNIHAVVDRPEFNLNPTNCSELAVTSDVTSTQGTVAHPQARFQVDGCEALKFKPKLTLKLKGGTKRAQYPALTAILEARKGDANIAKASVALPHSEFLAQEHIGTICTRVQFAADKCPKGSVYGKAKAITPLLDKPLAGPVYLRSSNHPLPDLVAKLGGELEIDLVGRIDSIHGGIRTTFESVPDAPVSKFVLQMKGGNKSLLTNSTDVCRGSHRATGAFKAQNGRAAQLRPVLQSGGCGKRLGKHKH